LKKEREKKNVGAFISSCPFHLKLLIGMNCRKKKETNKKVINSVCKEKGEIKMKPLLFETLPTPGDRHFVL
jgi:hypothetical protein